MSLPEEWGLTEPVKSLFEKKSLAWGTVARRHTHEHVVWEVGMDEGVDDVVLDELKVEARGDSYQ